MAALPRKSDPDGAASLPWRTIARARGSAIRANWEGSSSSPDPFFSRNAAFLLDAMAALPRKWVSGGAPTLESTSALTLLQPNGTRLRGHFWNPIHFDRGFFKKLTV
jgi:hypothetical protein